MNGKGYTGYGYMCRCGGQTMEFVSPEEAYEYMSESEENE